MTRPRSMWRASCANSPPDPRRRTGASGPGSGAGRIALLTLALALPAARAAPAADPDASPLLDRHYQAPEWSGAPPAVVGERDMTARRFAVVGAAGVQTGMRIADFSVGQGLTTALFARAVGPEGIVYGVGSAPDLPEVLTRLARQYHVSNLVPIASTGEDDRLPRGGIDLAFIGGGLGQFTDPRTLLEGIHRALIPYGTLIVIAPRPVAGPARGPRDRRSPDRDTLLELARQAGFRLLEEPPVLPDHAYLRLERIGAEPAADPAAPQPAPRHRPAPPTRRRTPAATSLHHPRDE